MGQNQGKKDFKNSHAGPFPKAVNRPDNQEPRAPGLQATDASAANRPDNQEPYARSFPSMASLATNMAQYEILLYEVKEELQNTDSRLDEASAKETLASLAQAKQRFEDQHSRSRQRYQEIAQQLTQLFKKAQHLIRVQETEEEEEKTQSMTIGSEILHRKLEKTIGDYIQEGITNRFEELANQDSDLDLPHLRQALPHLTKDLDAKINKKALARLTSLRLPFTPTKVITMFFSNEDYSELNKLFDFKGFKNLETLRYDQEKFIQGLKCLGVKKEDFKEYRNIDKKRFIETFAEVRKECHENNKAGEKTLVLFSYGGHGIQDGLTYALTNTIERKEIAFNLEGNVRILAEIPNTYVVALFDCCREKMTCKDIIHGKATTSSGPSRGGTDGKSTQQDDQKHEDDGKPRNLIIVFGCKPYSFTPADSKLIVQFFHKIGEMCDEREHIVQLPGSLSSWKPNNKGEVLSFTTHDLIIPFDHTVSPECFLHQPSLKQDCIASAKRAYETKALLQQAIEKQSFMFANNVTDTILRYTEYDGRWETLQCYNTSYFSYTDATCNLNSKLFQLGADGTCQVLIPDPDPTVLKFTVEARKPHPYQAKWHKATLIALPGDSSVLVCGLKWDAGYLNPWLYDLFDNEWNYKRKHGVKKDSPQTPIPTLPCVRIQGSGCCLGQAGYLFCGLDEQGRFVKHIDRLDLQTWSEWQQIKTPQTEQMVRFSPFVSPVNQTEVLIIGGKKSGQSLQDVYVFNTETEETSCLGDSGLTSENWPLQTALPNDSGQVIACDLSWSGRLIQVTRHVSSGAATTKRLKESDEAANQVTHIPPYDSNYVLNLHGIKGLTKEQTLCFDQWYELQYDFYKKGIKDFVLTMMRDELLVPKIKKIYEQQHVGVMSKMFGIDTRQHVQKELNEQQQVAFLKEIWLLSRQTFPAAAATKDVPETADYLAAKMKAIQSLGQAESTTFSWKDFKRAYKMMNIWIDAKRYEHIRRVRAAATAAAKVVKAMEELKARIELALEEEMKELGEVWSPFPKSNPQQPHRIRERTIC